jgi:hypothetical protein
VFQHDANGGRSEQRDYNVEFLPTSCGHCDCGWSSKSSWHVFLGRWEAGQGYEFRRKHRVYSGTSHSGLRWHYIRKSTVKTIDGKVIPSAMSISAKTNGPQESRSLRPNKVDLDALHFTARPYQDIEVYQSLSYMTTHPDLSTEELRVKQYAKGLRYGVKSDASVSLVLPSTKASDQPTAPVPKHSVEAMRSVSSFESPALWGHTEL